MIHSEEIPRLKVIYEIGQDISALSADELELQIGELEHEITRLKNKHATRIKTRSAAEALFKK